MRNSAEAAPAIACSLREYAAAKRLDPETLAAYGLRDSTYRGTPALEIPYWDRARADSQIRIRRALTGSHRFAWKMGSKTRPYGLWRLPADTVGESIALVEGESDCHTLWQHEIPALGLPGAGTLSCGEQVLSGFERILCVREPDGGGDRLLSALSASPLAPRVAVVQFAMDVSDLYMSDPAQFPEAWAASIEIARPLESIANLTVRQPEAAQGELGTTAIAPGLPIPKHSRNPTLFRRAQLLKQAGADRQAGSALLQRLNQETCDPPLRRTEVAGIARSVWDYKKNWWKPWAKVGRAKRLLLRALAHSESGVEVTELIRIGEDHDTSLPTMRRARKKLNRQLGQTGFQIVTVRHAAQAQPRGTGHWRWMLAVRDPVRDPSPSQ